MLIFVLYYHIIVSRACYTSKLCATEQALNPITPLNYHVQQGGTFTPLLECRESALAMTPVIMDKARTKALHRSALVDTTMLFMGLALSKWRGLHYCNPFLKKTNYREFLGS